MLPFFPFEFSKGETRELAKKFRRESPNEPPTLNVVNLAGSANFLDESHFVKEPTENRRTDEFATCCVLI